MCPIPDRTTVHYFRKIDNIRAVGFSQLCLNLTNAQETLL